MEILAFVIALECNILLMLSPTYLLIPHGTTPVRVLLDEHSQLHQLTHTHTNTMATMVQNMVTTVTDTEHGNYGNKHMLTMVTMVTYT